MEEGKTASATKRNTHCLKSYTVINKENKERRITKQLAFLLHLCSLLSLSLGCPFLDIQALAEVCPKCSS